MPIFTYDFAGVANAKQLNYFKGSESAPSGTRWVRVVNACYNNVPIAVEIDGAVSVAVVGNNIFPCRSYIKVIPNPTTGLGFNEGYNENEESVIVSFFKEYPDPPIRFMKN